MCPGIKCVEISCMKSVEIFRDFMTMLGSKDNIWRVRWHVQWMQECTSNMGRTLMKLMENEFNRTT